MKVLLNILKATGIVIGSITAISLFFAGYSWLAEEVYIKKNTTVAIWFVGILLVACITITTVCLTLEGNKK